MIRPSRRFVLGWAAALATLAIFRHPRAAGQPEDLLACLGDRRAAARIGRAALAERPELGGDVGALRHALDRAVAAVGDTGPLRRRLGRMVRDDFSAGRIERVQGWMLSETETRLCVLAALSAT